jgi:hypothetical protein
MEITVNTKSFLEKRLFEHKTELCGIMSKYGSDKGNHHNYSTLYHYLFGSIKPEKLNIFEVGLGTNNTSVPSNMGPHGKPGASLRGWKEYFVNSNIYGADVDSGILFEEDRILTFFVDQTKKETIDELWNSPILSTIEFDIIIDDGLHEFHANKKFFENSIQKLKKSGVFIIEDVSEVYLGEFIDWVNNNVNNFNSIEILTIPINGSVQENNRLVIIKK